MKPAKICRSLPLLGVLTFSLVVPLFPASACAGEPTASTSGVAPGVSASGLASKWMGAYDPFSRACSGNVLTISGSTFTWGDCKEVTIRMVAAFDTEFAFEVDPNAKCGWAGLIVALTIPTAESRAVDVNAYRSLIAYQAKESIAFCAYSKTAN